MSSSVDFYAHLGVQRTASGSDIKKAYFQLCKTHHPDRGGDPEKFKDIKKAYETLSNDELRKVYDAHGAEGLERHLNGGGMGGGDGFMGGDLNDILRQAFGMGGGPQRERGPPKGEDMQFRLRVSLPDLYNGKVQEIPVQRKETCAGCKGTGATKPGKAQPCTGCRGQGFRIVMRQMGPMMQQIKAVCPECEGEGRCIEKKFRCKTCNGQQIVVKEVTIRAEIPPGTSDGETIKLAGESHQEPGGIAGDVLIQIKEHKTEDCEFERHNDDLLFKKKITLTQAICGYRFNITHMDGRQLTISSEEGTVVAPGSMQLVHDEGMPKKQNRALRGSLFIQFEIAFPSASEITPELRDLLTRIAPAPQLDAVHEELTAVPFDPARDPPLGSVERGTSTRGMHSDDDEQQGGASHTCVHQ